MTPWSTNPDRNGTIDGAIGTTVPYRIFVTPVMEARPDQAISEYDDDIWDLSPIARKINAKNRQEINFNTIPVGYQETAKRIAWCWINLRTPVEKLERVRSAARNRLSTSSISYLLKTYGKYFFNWLEQRGIKELAQVTRNDFNAYLTDARARKPSWETLSQQLFTITRIWLLNPYLPESDRLPMPPWEEAESAGMLGKSNWTAENKTPPIHPQTMSALYMWAERFLTIFAPDILRAKDMSDDIRAKARLHVIEGDRQRFREYKAKLTNLNLPLPGHWREPGKMAAVQFISGLHDIGMRAMSPQDRKGMAVSDTTPLPLTISGVIPGDTTSWREYIDHYEVSRLRVRLATACLIVATYLSGMRAEEVTQLRRGCVQAIPHQNSQPNRYAITGLVFKSASDEDGNALPHGQIRERPWYAIEPIAKAIQLCESLSRTEYVFDSDLFLEFDKKHADGPVGVTDVKHCILDFLDWVNDYCETNNRLNETIPVDPQGNITLSRFRRTLAWFIYRQPGGRVALGVQYAHLRSHTSEGYGQRTSSGLTGVFPMEEALSVADYLATASENLKAGEGVSGPASTRYIKGTSQFTNEYGGNKLSHKELNAMMKNPRYRIYDSGMQALACNYDATKALCHPDNNLKARPEQSPDLTRCQPQCMNIARTDRHTAGLMAEVNHLEQLIQEPALPEPIRGRYKQRIQTLLKIVSSHENSKVTL